MTKEELKQGILSLLPSDELSIEDMDKVDSLLDRYDEHEGEDYKLKYEELAEKYRKRFTEVVNPEPKVEEPEPDEETEEEKFKKIFEKEEEK